MRQAGTCLYILNIRFYLWQGTVRINLPVTKFYKVHYAVIHGFMTGKMPVRYHRLELYTNFLILCVNCIYTKIASVSEKWFLDRRLPRRLISYNFIYVCAIFLPKHDMPFWYDFIEMFFIIQYFYRLVNDCQCHIIVKSILCHIFRHSYHCAPEI